jgi:sirohydrochlorin ferrochelatase
VELAFLELMQPDLPTVAAQQVAAGSRRVTVIPVFLGQGGHVRRDLPQLLEQLRQAHPGVEVRTVAAVGEDEAVLQAIAAYCVGTAELILPSALLDTTMARKTGHLLLGEGLSPSEQARRWVRPGRA